MKDLKVRDARLDLISRPLFLIGVLLLMLNDFYLKYEYANWLTGKLSDLAGLFVFPYFFSSLKTSSSRYIYLTTAMLFVFWKSSASQGVIDWIQSTGIGMNRTVDYSDLAALLVLPFSLRYFTLQLNSKMRVQRIPTILVSLISLGAFWATTLPREQVEVNMVIDTSYQLAMSKANLLEALTAGHPYSEDSAKNMSDSLFYLTFDIEDHYAQVRASATIKDIGADSVVIRLNRILYGYITGELFSGVDTDKINSFKALEAEDYKKYFEENFIRTLERRGTEGLYYDNKEIDDSYQKE